MQENINNLIIAKTGSEAERIYRSIVLHSPHDYPELSRIEQAKNSLSFAAEKKYGY